MSYCLCPTILESGCTRKSITNSARAINTIIGQSIKIYIDSDGSLLKEYKNIKNIDNIIYDYFINYIEDQIEDMNYDLVNPINNVIKNYTKFQELLIDLSKNSSGPIILSDKSNYNGFVLTGCSILEPKDFLSSISGNTTNIGTVNGGVQTNATRSPQYNKYIINNFRDRFKKEPIFMTIFLGLLVNGLYDIIKFIFSIINK